METHGRKKQATIGKVFISKQYSGKATMEADERIIMIILNGGMKAVYRYPAQFRLLIKNL